MSASAASASASCGGCSMQNFQRPSYRRKSYKNLSKKRRQKRKYMKKRKSSYIKVYKNSPLYKSVYGPKTMETQTDLDEGNWDTMPILTPNKRRFVDHSQSTTIDGSGAYNLHQKLIDISGSGAYNLNFHAQTNQLFNKSPERILSTLNNETGDIILTQSEFLFDITPPAYGENDDGAGVAGTKFRVYGNGISSTTSTYVHNPKPLVLNPGCKRTFPWLSKIAANFQEYEFIQLVFEYKPVISDGNTNASGTIVMFTQYNPNQITGSNEKFGTVYNKRDAEGLDYTNSVKVIQGALHGVECDPKKINGTREKLIREEDNSLGTPVGNLIDYDLGLFTLAGASLSPTCYTTNHTASYSTFTCETTTTNTSTQFNDCTLTFAAGAAATLNPLATTFGELWVHYSVKLSKKKVSKTS